MKPLLHSLMFIYSVFGWNNGSAEDLSSPDILFESGLTNFALHPDIDSCFHPIHEHSTAENHHRMKRCEDLLQLFRQKNHTKSQNYIASTNVEKTDHLRRIVHRRLMPRPTDRAAHHRTESAAQADLNTSHVLYTVPCTTDSISSYNSPEQTTFHTTNVLSDKRFTNIVSSKTLNHTTTSTFTDGNDYEVDPKTKQENKIHDKNIAASSSDLSGKIKSVTKIVKEENIRKNPSTRTHIAQASLTPFEIYYAKKIENKKNSVTSSPKLTSQVVNNYAHKDQPGKPLLLQNQNLNSMVFSLSQAPALEFNPYFTPSQQTMSQLRDNFESSTLKQLIPYSYLIQHQIPPLRSTASSSKQVTEPEVGSHFFTSEAVGEIVDDVSIHKSRFTQHQNHSPKTTEFTESKAVGPKIETHSPTSKAVGQTFNKPSNEHPIHETYLTQRQTPPFHSLTFSSSPRVNSNFTIIPTTVSQHLNNQFNFSNNYQIHKLHGSQHQTPLSMTYSQVPVSEIDSHLISTPKSEGQLHKTPLSEYPIHKSHPILQHQTSLPNSIAFTSSQTPSLQVNSNFTPVTMSQHHTKHFKSSYSPQIHEPRRNQHHIPLSNTMAFSYNKTPTPVIDPHLTFTPEADSQLFNNPLHGYLTHKSHLQQFYKPNSPEPFLNHADALAHFTTTSETLNHNPKYDSKSHSHEHPYHKSHHTQHQISQTSSGYGIKLKASVGFPHSIVRSPLPPFQLPPPSLPAVSESDSSIEGKCALNNPQLVASYQMVQPEFSLIEHTFEPPTRIFVTDTDDLVSSPESAVIFSEENTKGYEPTTSSPDEVELITLGKTKPSIRQKNITTSYDIQTSVEELEREIETLEDQSTSEKPSNYFPKTRKPSVTSTSDSSNPAVTIPVWSGVGRLPSNPMLVTIPREDGTKLTLTDEAGIENVADFLKKLALNQGNLNEQTFSYHPPGELSNGMYDTFQKYTNYKNSTSIPGFQNTSENDEENLPNFDSSVKDTSVARSVSSDDFRETIQEIINSPTESSGNSGNDFGTQSDRLVDHLLQDFENSDRLSDHAQNQKPPGEVTSVTLDGSIITNHHTYETMNKNRQLVQINPNDNWKIIQNDASSIQTPAKEIQRIDNSSVFLIWTPQRQYIPADWLSHNHSNTSPSDTRNVSKSSTNVVSFRKLTNRNYTANLLHKINPPSEKNITIGSPKDGIIDRSSIQLEMANYTFNRMGVTPKWVNQPLNSSSSNESNVDVIIRKNKTRTDAVTKNYHNIFIIGENDADTLKAILSTLGMKPSKTDEEVIAAETKERPPTLSRSTQYQPSNEDVVASHISGSSGPITGAVESTGRIYGATLEHEPINKSLKQYFHFVNPGILRDFAEVYNRYASNRNLSGDLNSKRVIGKGRTTSSNDDTIVKTLRQLVKLRSSIPKILTSGTHIK